MGRYLVLLQFDMSCFLDIHRRPVFPEQKQQRSGLGVGTERVLGQGLGGEEEGETVLGLKKGKDSAFASYLYFIAKDPKVIGTYIDRLESLKLEAKMSIFLLLSLLFQVFFL